jgi:hypothetical protein
VLYRVGGAVFVERDYRGYYKEDATGVHLSGMQKNSRDLRISLNSRNAFEPGIGHLKIDNGLDRK